MRENDWKKRLGVVYSTRSDYGYIMEETHEPVPELPPHQQKLRVSIEKSGRSGKTVTLVRGFVGEEEALKSLGKRLKTKCGVGGTVKDGVILVQGDFRDRIVNLLQTEGFVNVK